MVRVDEAWRDDFAVAVDDFCIRWRSMNVLADFSNDIASDKDVRVV